MAIYLRAYFSFPFFTGTTSRAFHFLSLYGDPKAPSSFHSSNHTRGLQRAIEEQNVRSILPVKMTRNGRTPPVLQPSTNMY